MVAGLSIFPLVVMPVDPGVAAIFVCAKERSRTMNTINEQVAVVNQPVAR
jgi:hypothetical protein